MTLNRERLFTPEVRSGALADFARVASASECRVPAFAIISNHLHLVVQQGEGDAAPCGDYRSLAGATSLLFAASRDGSSADRLRADYRAVVYWQLALDWSGVDPGPATDEETRPPGGSLGERVVGGRPESALPHPRSCGGQDSRTRLPGTRHDHHRPERAGVRGPGGPTRSPGAGRTLRAAVQAVQRGADLDGRGHVVQAPVKSSISATARIRLWGR